LPENNQNSFNQSSVDKILVTAHYANIDVAVTHQSPINLQQFPLSKITTFDWTWPVLITDDGPLWDTNAIIRYVARRGESQQLLGQSPFQQSQIDQWVEFSSTSLHLAVSSWTYPLKGYFQLSPADNEIAKNAVLRLLKIVEDHLKNHTFLVGDRLSIADIILSLTVRDLYVHVFDESLCRTYQNTTRWYLTCTSQPSFVSSVAEQPKYLAQSHFYEIHSNTKTTHSVVSRELSLEETHNEEAEGGEGEAGAVSDGGAISEGGGGATTTDGSDNEQRLVKKEKKKKGYKRDIAAINASKAIQAVAQKEHYLPRKLTDKDLYGKAIPSAYTHPQPTKSQSSRHPSTPTGIQAIQQPK
jgi:elongation factor 1-gamma